MSDRMIYVLKRANAQRIPGGMATIDATFNVERPSGAAVDRISIAVVAACIGLAAPATRANAELLSATRTVIAILADDLFVGEAKGHLSGAGTLAIRSQVNPDLTCLGDFTSSAALGGSGQMQCSDGTTATFRFQRLSVYRGYGVANFSRGSMSFAYGLSDEEAEPYLKLPEGKKLTRDGAVLALVKR